jgi:drug/metabolite transporter (DMT)-like permease
MPRTAHYWIGLLMLCVSAVFAVGVGSVLQYRAIARQAALNTAYSEPFTASVVPPSVYYRRASF